jgi:hypothetical protein
VNDEMNRLIRQATGRAADLPAAEGEMFRVRGWTPQPTVEGSPAPLEPATSETQADSNAAMNALLRGTALEQRQGRTDDIDRRRIAVAHGLAPSAGEILAGNSPQEWARDAQVIARALGAQPASRAPETFGAGPRGRAPVPADPNDGIRAQHQRRRESNLRHDEINAEEHQRRLAASQVLHGTRRSW